MHKLLMRLDPKRLLDLLAIASHGSFTAAADALHTSQPALSQSIATLEHGVGARLLERDRQGARLTEDGEALVFYARSLESVMARAKAEMQLRQQGIEGTLAIGISPVTAVGLVPAALAQLLEQTPNIAVTITEGLDDNNIAKLRERELDLVVSRHGRGSAHRDIAEEPLMQADWCVILRHDHPLAGKKQLHLQELAGYSWVLPSAGSSFRLQMEAVFLNAGMSLPARSVSTNSVLAIKAIVMNTECVTLMAPSLVEVECVAGRLRSVALADLGDQRPVGLMWRRDEELSPVALRFADILRQCAAGSPAGARA